LVFPGGLDPLQLPAQNPALHLIQEIRDEAHRFAITGHRAQRSKARKTSTLDSLPGIGPARRKSLVARFGGLAGVQAARPEQLAEVPGISQEMAEKIYSALH
jgi:excinuclease ABC subunit C